MSEPSEKTETPDSYESALERLEEIIAALDSGSLGLRETLALTREAKGLIEYCSTELESVSGELRELGLDDLVERLEAPPSP